MGRVKAFGSPVKSSGEFAEIRRPAPWLGQHTAEILRSLGRTDDEIERLFADGVVFDKYRDRPLPT
jgi:crotonobetainyl-CoA:carnitine CoA-transferase CaiB-like acyl-CoA transferase